LQRDSAGFAKKKNVEMVETLRKIDVSIAKQALEWTMQDHTGRRRPEHLNIDLQKAM